MKRTTSIVLFFLLVFGVISCNPPEKHIWMIGDSTMAAKDKDRLPESGWGVGLSEYVRENVTVHNHAASGRSTLSFINEGRWDVVFDSLQKGDFVIIQFGHNDEKPDSARHTDPYGSFKVNLRRFIDDTKAKGANPIICSSIVRRHFYGDGRLKETHGDYIPAAEEAAAEAGVPYVDMNHHTGALVQEFGPELSKKLFTFTDSKQDSTHLNVKGSSLVAELFVVDVKARDLPVANLFK